MDFSNLLFSPAGRISRRTFWIGFAILLVLSIVISLVTPALGVLGGLIGFVVNLLIIYMSVCVYAKRLHDFGRSGWLYGLLIIASIVLAFIVLGPAIMAGVEAASQDPELANDQEALEAIMMENMDFGRMAMIYIPTIIFTLWVGLMPGHTTDNKYGPALDTTA